MEYQILIILFIHWIADFVLQSNTMATNKSTSKYWLTLHVLTYSSVWLALGVWYFDPWMVSAFVAITFACHWITDYFTSKWTARLWKEGEVHNFFVVVGFDQFLHFTQLILTYSILNSR